MKKGTAISAPAPGPSPDDLGRCYHSPAAAVVLAESGKELERTEVLSACVSLVREVPRRGDHGFHQKARFRWDGVTLDATGARVFRFEFWL